MTWTELFVWGIAAMLLAFAYFCLTWIFDPNVRKEAGVKLQGDPSDEQSLEILAIQNQRDAIAHSVSEHLKNGTIAFIKDYDDPKQHPDQWSEKIVLPARGSRPGMTIVIRHSPWEQEDGTEIVTSDVTQAYYTESGEQFFM